MLGTKAVPDTAIYLLADHLDAALAAGEDLLAVTLSQPTQASGSDVTDRVDAIDNFVGRLARNEASVIARVLQARRRAAALEKTDPFLAPLVKLFLANTAGVLDLVDRFGDKARVSFEGASGADAFLRSRGLVASDIASLAGLSAIPVTESYRLASVVEVGPLLDLVSAFLDAIDRHYDLYQDDADTPVLASLPAVAEGPTDADADQAKAPDAPPQGDAAAAGGADAQPVDASRSESPANTSSAPEKAAAGAPVANLTPSTLAEALAAAQRAN